MDKLWKYIIVLSAILTVGYCIADSNILNIQTNLSPVKGNGEIIKKQISVNDYSRIEVKVPANIFYELKTNEAPYLQIEVDKNLAELVSISVQRGCLVVDADQNINPKKLNIYTNSRSLSEVKNHSSGNIDVKGIMQSSNVNIKVFSSGNIKAENINGENVELSVSSSGNIKVSNIDSQNLDINTSSSGNIKVNDIKGDNVNVRTTSAGNININDVASKDLSISGNSSGNIKANDVTNTKFSIRLDSSGSAHINNSTSDDIKISTSSSGGTKIKGTATQTTLKTSGNGDINASGLETKYADCQVSGSGDISIYVTESLTAKIKGHGNIEYRGNPKQVKKTEDGSGKILSK